MFCFIVILFMTLLRHSWIINKMACKKLVESLMRTPYYLGKQSLWEVDSSIEIKHFFYLFD